jgi:hypothetical protein
MINRDYDRMIVLCYPKGAGGNFLINCLSLNDQCILRDSVLAEQQLNTGLSADKKLDYLMSQLENTKRSGIWNDFSLGCGQLFGILNQAYFNCYPEIIEKKFNYVFKQLIDQNKYLFLVAHNIQELDAYLKFWKKARVIFFVDYHDFVLQRPLNRQSDLGELVHYWNVVRNDNWPKNPPTKLDDFYKLDQQIQQELTQNFHGGIFRWIETSPTQDELHQRDIGIYTQNMQDRHCTWSVAKAFGGNEQQFLLELKNCAKWLNVTIDVTDADLVEFYKKWLEIIQIAR